MKETAGYKNDSRCFPSC